MQFLPSRRLLPMLFILPTLALPALAAAQVEIKKVEGQERYDVTIAGKPFTSYRYGDGDFFEKPVFYPVLSPNGSELNRQYPMVKDVKGEQHDHEHHQSVFFTYDEINDVHFWNKQVNPKRRIKHREASVEGATLKATLDWLGNQSEPVLEEKLAVTFGSGGGAEWMDHDITLKAVVDAKFGDTKEGAFAIRVTPSLQEVLGGKGRYLNAEGLETSKQCWGKTSAWMALAGPVTGPKGDEDVTIAIFSHPGSFNHPPYWHARDYGLFAANPFGRKSYDKTQEAREFTLKAGESLHLRYRLAVYEGKADKPRLDKDYAEFSK